MVTVLLLICIGLAIFPIHNKAIEKLFAFLILGIMICIFAGCNESVDQYAYKVLYSDPTYFTVEKGYLFISDFFATLGFNYLQFKAVLLLLSSLLIYSRIKNCTYVSFRMILLLWLLTSYWFDIEQSRYMISISIVIYSTRYLESKRIIHDLLFVLFVLLAFSIHTSAIVFLLLLLVQIDYQKLKIFAMVSCIATALIGIMGGNLEIIGNLVYNIIPNARILMWFSFSTKLGWIGPVTMQFITFYMVWYANRIINSTSSEQNCCDKNISNLFLKISMVLFGVMPLYYFSTEFIRLIRGFFVVYFAVILLAYPQEKISQKIYTIVQLFVFVVAFNLQGLRGILFYNDYFIENMILKNDINNNPSILIWVGVTVFVFLLLTAKQKVRFKHEF